MNSLRLRLPATSANLGPGFDALGLALGLYLNINASVASSFWIEATGCDADQVGRFERNLIMDTYLTICRAHTVNPIPLGLIIHNEIPLGKGCGSSAAAILAGVILANHFAGLDLAPQRVLDLACRQEGHPDNVAACFHGGLTISAMLGETVTSATLGGSLPWRLLLVVPAKSFATSEARALLPKTYSQAQVIQNIQSTALLVAAFALVRPDLLQTATRDSLHQPFRAEACPLLPALLPMLVDRHVFSVTLSGAGPSVLLITDPDEALEPRIAAILQAGREYEPQILQTHIAEGAQISLVDPLVPFTPTW